MSVRGPAERGGGLISADMNTVYRTGINKPIGCLPDLAKKVRKRPASSAQNLFKFHGILWRVHADRRV